MSLIKSTVEMLKSQGFSKDLISNCFNVLKYIYVGQNIREEGILQSDKYLQQPSFFKIVNQLLKLRFIKENKWYNHFLYLVTNEARALASELIKEHIDRNKITVQKELDKYPRLLLNFLIQEYISKGLNFKINIVQYFVGNWKDEFLLTENILEFWENLFQIIQTKELCVITHYYVSTRGGELREEKYVISSELRNFLLELCPEEGLTEDEKDYAKLYYLLNEKIKYRKKDDVITVSGDELRFQGSIDMLFPKLESLLEGLKKRQVISTPVFAIGGSCYFSILKKMEIQAILEEEIKEGLIQKLLGWVPRKKKEIILPVKKKEDFSQLVQRLVLKKFDLYRIVAQFEGKTLFKCSPKTEKCIVKLTNPLTGEVGLKDFIDDLHWFIEESSYEHILKFRKEPLIIKERSKFENWLNIEISSEYAEKFENSGEFLRDLNKLRNHYSHLTDAKGYYEAGITFNKLIGKQILQKEDIPKIQRILLEKTYDALENISRILTSILEKR